MGTRMELVAGRAQDILVVLSTAEGALDAAANLDAYLSLSGGMDPTWLDLFADAARIATERDVPGDFLDARSELDGRGDADRRGAPEQTLVIERVDPSWVTAVARVPDATLDRLTGRWIDRIEDEFGELAREEKPWIRDLAAQVVTFCRRADRAPDVLFVWALG